MWQIADWKTKINNSSTVECELCRNRGPWAFQLHESTSMLKSNKILVCQHSRIKYSLRLQNLDNIHYDAQCNKMTHKMTS